MKSSKGYAMVSTLSLSAILLLAVGVMMYKINTNTKDIIRAKLNSQALNVAEEGIEHTLNWLNVQNTSTSIPPLQNTLLNSTINLPGVISTNNVFKSIKENGEFEISLLSAGSATSTQDFIEITSTGYIPNKANFRAKKVVKSVIARPLFSGQGLDNAMHTDSSIDMGNGKTNSGNNTNSVSFTAEGHIHANGSINLGSNAEIKGDATAVNGISGLTPTKVSGTANPNAANIPVPQAKYEIDSTPCTMTLVGTKKRYGPPLGKDACTYTGSLPASNNDKVIISGTVYVTGSVSSSGQTTFESDPALPLSKLIVEGNVGFSGNATATPLTSRLMLVSRNGNVTISGNGTVYGIVFQENPNKSVTFNGQGNDPIGLFGAIIAKGNININGQVSVIRDLTLSAMDLVDNPNGRIVKVKSWRVEN